MKELNYLEHYNPYAFGMRVKYLREKRKLTQEELAVKIGYKDRSSINRIEKGKRDVKQETITLLARALNTSESYLMGWTEIESGDEYRAFISTKNKLYEMIAKMNKEQLDDFYDYGLYLLSKSSK